MARCGERLCGMQFAVLEKSLGGKRERRCDGIGWIYGGAAYTVVEKRSEIIDAIATETSLRSKDRPTKGRSTILSISLRIHFPPGRPPYPTPFLFFRKITHGGHLFVCSVRLLGPCSEIDRRLRPTDVCSAATALTLRHRKNIIGFSSFVLFFSFFFAFFLLMHHLLIRFLPHPISLGTGPRSGCTVAA